MGLGRWMMVDEAEAIYNESIVIDMRGMPSLTSEIGVSDLEASGVTMANIQGGTEGAMLLHNWYIDQFDNVTFISACSRAADLPRLTMVIGIDQMTWPPRLFDFLCQRNRIGLIFIFSHLTFFL